MAILGTRHALRMIRRPVYDRRTKLYAYEILFRAAPDDDPFDVVRTLVETGVERLAGGKLALATVPVSLLENPAFASFPASRAIVAPVEDVPLDDTTLRELAVRGLRFALDERRFRPGETSACKMVRVDVRGRDPESLRHAVRDGKAARVRMLASGVDTIESYALCSALGFDYLLGDFYAQPAPVHGRGLSHGRAVLVHLLTRLQEPHVTMEELERLVSADAALTERLLRLVNSACSALQERVESIRAALMLLGLEKIRSLVSLLAMSGVQDKPAELMSIAMVRAKMCEALAERAGKSAPEQYFTAGLLSMLDALFDMPMSEILEHLPLSELLRTALLDPRCENGIAEILQATLAYERQNWGEPEAVALGPDLAEAYVAAVGWADEAIEALAGATPR